MDDARSIVQFTAREYSDYLAAGKADVVEFLSNHLTLAQQMQERLQAFACLDERVVGQQAELRKAERTRGEPLGPLYGVPLVVEDLIDTVDFPTTYGSPIYEGRYPITDATAVRRLREAGAVIFAKAATAEFGIGKAAAVRNPHQPEHSAGGASGGAAAAVASGTVPLALTIASDGAVMLAASFCGVYGYQPSAGLLPRTGTLELSPSLDRLGLLARCVEDLALAAEIASGDDGRDRAVLAVPPRRLASVCAAEPPLEPKFCFVHTPWSPQITPAAREACEAFIELMHGVVDVAELPAIVEQAVPWHQQLQQAELAFALQREWRHHGDRLDSALRQRIERGAAVTAVDYLIARDRIPHIGSAFDEYFDRYDVLLMPAAAGPAPLLLSSVPTPEATMQSVWSLAGLPTVSMPLITLDDALPFGILAVGALHNDGRLLRAVRWLVNEFVRRGNT